MKAGVLIVGGGGREHALAAAMMQSPMVGRVFMTAVNGGCQAFAMPQSAGGGEQKIDGGDTQTLADFCKGGEIDLVIIGPEAPLADGLADVLRAARVRVFAPSQKAAKIEYSKIYAKTLMTDNNIPTLPFAIVKDAAQVAKWCAGHQPPFVIKADSLAGGKGVYLCDSEEEAQASAAAIWRGKFGGRGVIAEQYCGGVETSFIVVADGKNAIPLPTSCDYKRLTDGGKGANTGGMGAVSPSPFFDDAARDKVMARIIHPALSALAKDGAPFCGFLYAGLVLDDNGEWRVLEFNCRMGDPEAQAILPRLSGDLFPLLYAAAAKAEDDNAGGLHGLAMPKAEGASVCIVLAAEGYPQKPVIGDEITIDNIPDGVRHYHAATKQDGGKLLTNGGRVMSIVAVADDNESAAKLAYQGAAGVNFRAMHYRRDIGKL